MERCELLPTSQASENFIVAFKWALSNVDLRVYHTAVIAELRNRVVWFHDAPLEDSTDLRMLLATREFISFSMAVLKACGGVCAFQKIGIRFGSDSTDLVVVVDQQM